MYIFENGEHRDHILIEFRVKILCGNIFVEHCRVAGIKADEI